MIDYDWKSIVALVGDATDPVRVRRALMLLCKILEESMGEIGDAIEVLTTEYTYVVNTDGDQVYTYGDGVAVTTIAESEER